jgi:hypothetical protein
MNSFIHFMAYLSFSSFFIGTAETAKIKDFLFSVICCVGRNFVEKIVETGGRISL